MHPPPSRHDNSDKMTLIQGESGVVESVTNEPAVCTQTRKSANTAKGDSKKIDQQMTQPLSEASVRSGFRGSKDPKVN